ncbi:MAG TPA: aminotransferase class V-fold PLP-dependent enzyme [Vicinamibacterales bacterium]|nr:aminotransferase class V-fold PLP-dependent enzyme [Vicinamibacterales bacterium]
MWTRRSFLRTTSVLGTAALTVRTNGLAEILAAAKSVQGQSPDQVARDEGYWREIQQAFALDRTLINLNTGNHCSQPTVVLDAVKRYLDMQNLAPVYYAGLINRNVESVRRGLAGEFGCDPEELAITRNASESLQILQNGIDLAAGDEVITTEQDYPRMLTTWDQRVRRDKITVTRIQFPVPTTQQDLFERVEKAITPRTKVLHFCHITNLTGQLFPVQQISRMARARGIRTIVDGAHAGAQFPFKLRELECDSYGVSLHKWLLAPFGTGILFVKRDQIANVWPLQAAPARSANDIRKFEEIGTAPAGTRAAIADALAFHQAIGAERKAARLYYLTMRWATPLGQLPRVQMHSSLKPGQTWGLATVGIQGLEPGKISTFLWDRYRIIVAGISGSQPPGPKFDYQGIRVTPNIYTTIQEIDTFVGAMKELLSTPTSALDSMDSTRNNASAFDA